MGEFDLDSVGSSFRDRPYRIMLVGPPKVGKSTFAGTLPDPIFLPIRGEEGIDALDVQAFPTIKRFEDIIDALSNLYMEDHDFKTVVIDSVSALEPIIWDETCRINEGVDTIEKVGGGYGRGYTEALKQWREVTEGLDALRNDKDMGCVLIGHVKVEKFNDPELEPYDRYTLAVHKKPVQYLTRWSDGILFMRKKVAVRKDDVGFGNNQERAVDLSKGKSFLYTQSRPAHPGGGRGKWDELPYEMEAEWDSFNKILKGSK